MLKKLLFIAISMFPLLLEAQDKIITVGNDTIKCKITEIHKSTILFEIKTKGIKQKGEIDRAEVKGYYFSDPSSQYQINHVRRDRSISTDLQKIQIELNGGLSYLAGSSSVAEKQLINNGFDVDDVKNYYTSYKKGTALGISIHKLFFNNVSGSLGWGADYLFDTRRQKVSGYAKEGNIYIWSNCEETIYTNYVGASFIAIKNISRIPKLHFYIDENMGFNLYRNEMIYFDNPQLITAFSFATMTKYGFLFDITPNLLFDVNVSFFDSMYSKYRMNDGHSSGRFKLAFGYYELLSKGIVCVGFRYNFTKRNTK